jgi:dTDP-4-amino-4,6-dideoxygalactose transaminase
VKHAIAVSNGTDALTLGLSALGIGHGDEVITAANSFIATAEAIVHAGATPVFIDVDPRTYNIDVRQIEEHITARTKAVMPVHLFGQPADMDPILRLAHQRNLFVIEDSAQAHGARYKGKRTGSMGDIGCFSFYPGKNLGACGDAGAVVTNEVHLALELKKLRDHGGIKKYQHDLIGYNSRMDTLQAAVLLAKLNDLDARNEMRRAHAETYHRLLSRIPGIVTPVVMDQVESVFHLYVIQLQKGSRHGLQQYLLESGVQTGIHYPTPIHKTKAFAHFGHLQLPIAERIGERMLSLPIYPELEKNQIEYVVEMIFNYMSEFN